MSLAELNYLSYAFLETLAGAAIRSACFALLCAVAIWLLRTRKPELKHFMWSGALYALLLLPLLQLAAPPLHPAAPLLRRANISFLSLSPGQPVVHAVVTASTVTRPVASVASPRPFPWMLCALSLYFAIASALLVRLTFSLRRVQSLVRRSEPILDPGFRALCHDVWLESLSPVRPRVRLSADVNIPLAVGADEPVILLPPVWPDWSREKLHAVLAHEMAHVRRGDPGTALLSSMAVCLFWFHPLSYWLRRQLTNSAEESCDETVLRFIQPERYSQILIEFATTISAARGRLVAVSSVAAPRSQIAKRIERIFSPHPGRQLSEKLVQALAVVVLCPALYLTAAARFQAEQSGFAQEQDIAVSQVQSIANEQQAAEIEAKLQTDPNNMSIRAELMSFYFNTRNDAALAKHELWVVEHRPESSLVTMQPMPRHGTAGDPEIHRELTAAWEAALVKHPDSAAVLYHAGAFLVRDNPLRALELYKKAQSMTSPDSDLARNILRSTAVVYADVIVEGMPDPNRFPARIDQIHLTPADAAQLRADFAASQDPALISEVGTVLAQFTFVQKGAELIQQAIALDPTNPALKEALDSAQAEPIRQRNAKLMGQAAQQPSGPNAPSPVLRVGAKVQAANLLSHPDPVYPPLALQAQVQGSVEFTILIGVDGKVQNIELVRGHPILVNAAKDAVAQYTYKPTLLNGQPVAVSTSVAVDFHLDQ